MVAERILDRNWVDSRASAITGVPGW